MTIAYITPLIGLLGTVIGLVDTFVKFSAVSGQATTVDLSQGVYQSLITSATGLVVAIPTFILYSYLATYAKTLMHDMERGGIEVVNMLTDRRGHDDDIISFEDEARRSRKGESGHESRNEEDGAAMIRITSEPIGPVGWVPAWNPPA